MAKTCDGNEIGLLPALIALALTVCFVYAVAAKNFEHSNDVVNTSREI